MLIWPIIVLSILTYSETCWYPDRSGACPHAPKGESTVPSRCKHLAVIDIAKFNWLKDCLGLY